MPIDPRHCMPPPREEQQTMLETGTRPGMCTTETMEADAHQWHRDWVCSRAGENKAYVLFERERI